MLRNYFKTALRNFFRHNTYTMINIAGLCLGLGFTILIMLYLKDEVSYDNFHKNAPNIYRVVVAQMDGKGTASIKLGNTGFIQGPRFEATIPEIKSYVRTRSGFEDFKIGDEIKGQPVLYADPDFFSLFSFRFLRGNPPSALSVPNGVVLSEDAARAFFGTSDVVGKVVSFRKNDQFIAHTVTGVTARCPQNSSITFDVVLPLSQPAEAVSNPEQWFNFFLTTYLHLNEGVDINVISHKMNQVYRAEAGDMIQKLEKEFQVTDKTAYSLQRLTAMHLDSEVSGTPNASNSLYSYILSGIAIFILLIACINFVNLSVARSLTRAKEIGIRKVAGSQRYQLTFQFLGESFLLTFIAFLFSLLIVVLTLPLFNSVAGKAISLTSLLDIKLIVGFVTLFIFTWLMSGLYPAVVLSGFNPVSTLYGRYKLTGRNYLHRSLVVVQFSIASFMIVATVTIYYQFNLLTSTPLGYSDVNLVTVNKSSLTREEASLFTSELLQNLAIDGVAASNEGYSFNPVTIGGLKIGAANMTIDESFLPLLKIPVVAGRNFSTEFPGDAARSVIVNETFVEKAGLKNPIGLQVAFDDQERYEIVGVIRDYHFQSLNNEIVPQILSMRTHQNYGMEYIKIKTGREREGLVHIEKIFKKLFPLSAYSYSFKDQENLLQYQKEAIWKKIILYGAILIVFISCIGLFGLSVLAAQRRTAEMAIRKVLGASVIGIAMTLLMDFLKLVFIAMVISMPFAWFAGNKWLQNYAYRIPINWEVFGVSGILIVLIAFITISSQAIKTAKANPVRSIRRE